MLFILFMCSTVSNALITYTVKTANLKFSTRGEFGSLLYPFLRKQQIVHFCLKDGSHHVVVSVASVDLYGVFLLIIGNW